MRGYDGERTVFPQPFTPTFSGHETFVLRTNWLKKGYDVIKQHPDLFSRPDAYVKLGVGKNMAQSIRYWGRVVRDAAIDEWKITFLPKEHGGDFEPRLDSDEDWDMWMLAAARPERIPLRAMKIDTGWKIEVCLDRDRPDPYWCELVLKDVQMIDMNYRMERINSSLKRVRVAHAHMSEALHCAAAQLKVNTIVKVGWAGAST